MKKHRQKKQESKSHAKKHSAPARSKSHPAKKAKATAGKQSKHIRESGRAATKGTVRKSSHKGEKRSSAYNRKKAARPTRKVQKAHTRPARKSAKAKARTVSSSQKPKQQLKHSRPSRKAWKSPFRKYTQRLPKRGQATVYAIARVTMQYSAKDVRLYQIPVLIGRRTRKQALALTKADVEEALRYGIKRETELVDVQGLVALKPYQKRKGVRVFQRVRGAKQIGKAKRATRTHRRAR